MIKNSQSKKQSIVGKTPRIMLFDTEQQMLLSKTGELLFGTIHLFKVTFTKEELEVREVKLKELYGCNVVKLKGSVLTLSPCNFQTLKPNVTRKSNSHRRFFT